MLKKSFISLVVATLSLNANFLSKDTVDKDFNNLEIFKKNNVTVSSVYKEGNIYITNIKVNNMKDTVFLSEDKKYMFTGGISTESNGEALSSPVNLNIAKNKEAFTFGKGEEEYLLFTDPECPFCKKFEEFLPELENKVKIKVFYLPLVDMHPTAKEVSKYQMSLKDKMPIIDILKIDNKNPGFINRTYDEKTSKLLEDKVNEQMKIADEFNINSTPTLIDSKGKKITWTNFLQKQGIKLSK